MTKLVTFKVWWSDTPRGGGYTLCNQNEFTHNTCFNLELLVY